MILITFLLKSIMYYFLDLKFSNKVRLLYFVYFLIGWMVGGVFLIQQQQKSVSLTADQAI